MISFPKIRSYLRRPEALFSALLIFVLILNAQSLAKDLKAIIKVRQSMPFQPIGQRYADLTSLLKDIPYAGYYTDRNLELLENNKQFSQAQYLLAPTVLDAGNLKHEYIIFDCSNPLIAKQLIEQIRARVIRINPYGVILAQKNS